MGSSFFCPASTSISYSSTAWAFAAAASGAKQRISNMAVTMAANAIRAMIIVRLVMTSIRKKSTSVFMVLKYMRAGGEVFRINRGYAK